MSIVHLQHLESLARILLTSDALEGTAGRNFAASTFFSKPMASVEWLAISADIVSYRLKAAPCSMLSHGAFKSTYSLMTAAYDGICMNASGTGHAVQLYYAMEQMFIRQIMTTPPNDLIYVFQFFCTIRTQSTCWRIMRLGTMLTVCLSDDRL